MKKYMERKTTEFKSGTILSLVRLLIDNKAEFSGTKVINGIYEDRDCEGSDILDFKDVVKVIEV